MMPKVRPSIDKWLTVSQLWHTVKPVRHEHFRMRLQALRRTLPVYQVYFWPQWDDFIVGLLFCACLVFKRSGETYMDQK